MQAAARVAGRKFGRARGACPGAARGAALGTARLARHARTGHASAPRSRAPTSRGASGRARPPPRRHGGSARVPHAGVTRASRDRRRRR
jgi:hypothetical protein